MAGLSVPSTSYLFVNNKKPAELFASAGLNSCVAANSASHPRRRAMRVMVVMMVPSQHEGLGYESRNASSIAKIRWRESGFVMRMGSNTQQPSLRLQPENRYNLSA
jgi:hypothetical protein